jgi:hypothetical protein
MWMRPLLHMLAKVQLSLFSGSVLDVSKAVMLGGTSMAWMP